MTTKLENLEWREFAIDEIFVIKPGKRLTKATMKKGKRPFIGASDTNNGITGFISNLNNSLDSNVLGVNYNGSVVENFYHPYQCLFTDDVKRFSLKDRMGNKYIYLFLKSIILKQKEKYRYGYKFNEKRMLRQRILLPVDTKGLPDYALMETIMREKEQTLRVQYRDKILNKIDIELLKIPIQHLSEKNWKEFLLNTIFLNIKRGKRLKTGDHKKGVMPYVSSTSINNGIDNFIGNAEKVRIFGKCLTIANSGSVGKCFYHDYKFVASDHVTKLANSDMNKYVYLFIATISSRLSEKYSFNREINDKRIQKEKIILPCDEKGNPDFEYMDLFMRRLEQKCKLQYLNYLNTVN